MQTCNVCGAEAFATVLSGGNWASNAYTWVCDAHNPLSLTPTFRKAALADEALALLRRWAEWSDGDMADLLYDLERESRALLARADSDALRSEGR